MIHQAKSIDIWVDLKVSDLESDVEYLLSHQTMVYEGQRLSLRPRRLINKHQNQKSL